MSKIDEKYADLFSLIWLAPNGSRYMAYCRTGDFPEYLIDVGELLKYFEDFGSIDLIVDMYRLVVGYVIAEIRPNELEHCIPMSFYNRIDDIGYFADTLERSIVRDANLIKNYVNWRTQKVRAL